ncbi:MAG TPA: GNAT family N-acetyltransferase [Sphingobium sp.]
MADWILRGASPGDAAAVSALLVRSYRTLWADHYPPELLADVLPFMTRANVGLLASGRFFVAMVGDGAGVEGVRAVACGGWSAQWPGTLDCCDPGISHLRHFATDPKWLRRGIGRAILGRCMEEAREAGFFTLMADAAYGAEPFYADAGFEIVGSGTAVIGGLPFSGSMMQRSL